MLDITDVVIAYATSIDRGDWQAYASVFTDPVRVDFSEAGLPPADFPRDTFVGFAQQGLEQWSARQHISPNHVVVSDQDDPDKAVCHSCMYAQHHLEGGEPDTDLYLMHGSYDNHVVRTEQGWKITSLTQHVSWTQGRNPFAPTPPDA